MARSRDHTVPIMYLRRFADGHKSTGQLMAGLGSIGAMFGSASHGWLLALVLWMDGQID